MIWELSIQARAIEFIEYDLYSNFGPYAHFRAVDANDHRQSYLLYVCYESRSRALQAC